MRSERASARQHKAKPRLPRADASQSHDGDNVASERRQQVADVIRKHNLTLIEDDPHAFLVPGTSRRLQLLSLNGRTCRRACRNASPRASHVTAGNARPRSRRGALQASMRAMVQMAAPLMTAIVVRWMRDGTAFKIIEAIVAEAQARQAARAAKSWPIMRMRRIPTDITSGFRCRDAWSSTQFGLHVQKHGVAVVTSDAFATRHPAPDFVRVAPGGRARTRADLTRALEILRDALAAHPPLDHVV